MHPEDTDRFRRFEDLVYQIAHDPKKEGDEGKEAEVTELKPSGEPPPDPPAGSKDTKDPEA